jgi:lysine-N-methylase
MSTAPTPARPRLASHVLARRHIIDGDEVIVLHDTRGGDLVRIGPREWTLLAQADGTRDEDGICLAAARAGAYRRASEIRGLLIALRDRGLLDDGVEHAPREESMVDRPLDVLPNFSFHCDASGECCATYGSVVFTSAEAARARSLLPHLLGGGDCEDRVFTPEHGTRSPTLAVTLVDGRCAYLGASGRCSIHEAGGELAKPRGCRVYPATFVDDGECVRVSVGVECACVLASAGRIGGSPLVAASATLRSHLDPGTIVVRLLDRIPLRGEITASREDLVSWSRAVVTAGNPKDAAAAFWALADAAGDRLDPDLATRALVEPSPPPVDGVARYIEALAARMAGRVATTESWRSVKDRTRITTRWLAEAVTSLRSRSALTRALERPEPSAESFYFRATIHGHHVVDEVPIERALRDHAVRVVVARAMGPIIARLAPDDPAARYPLALTQAMMRAHGIKTYAREIPVP